MAHQEEAEVRVEMLSEAKIEDEDIPTAFTKKVKMIELKPIPRKGRVLSQYKQDILCNRHLKWKSQLSIPVEGVIKFIFNFHYLFTEFVKRFDMPLNVIFALWWNFELLRL